MTQNHQGHIFSNIRTLSGDQAFIHKKFASKTFQKQRAQRVCLKSIAQSKAFWWFQFTPQFAGHQWLGKSSQIFKQIGFY
ncbi:UNKNOWN [Stylonychia lemnae]|uniref:Uncharacterized protein n=1 Tax=Stylonychia lemnae TaxID=5949 RepID=A0A078AJ05_STYLE|nr:UNKNOWN [Stylonychia lemnae]|eukprot:CDW81447.1 UNKNOWN [Stylonychia lemnae]